jgi:hypothetical protein
MLVFDIGFLREVSGPLEVETVSCTCESAQWRRVVTGAQEERVYFGCRGRCAVADALRCPSEGSRCVDNHELYAA